MLKLTLPYLDEYLGLKANTLKKRFDLRKIRRRSRRQNGLKLQILLIQSDVASSFFVLLPAHVKGVGFNRNKADVRLKGSLNTLEAFKSGAGRFQNLMETAGIQTLGFQKVIQVFRFLQADDGGHGRELPVDVDATNDDEDDLLLAQQFEFNIARDVTVVDEREKVSFNEALMDLLSLKQSTCKNDDQFLVQVETAAGWDFRRKVENGVDSALTIRDEGELNVASSDRMKVEAVCDLSEERDFDTKLTQHRRGAL